MIDFNKKNILVVVAHPDDEILGVGGTINMLVNKYECFVKVLILSKGITSRGDNDKNFENEIKVHSKNILDAKKILGYQELETLNFPDNNFDRISLLEIIKSIEKVKKSFNPEIIFTHHGGDLNIDHQLTYKSVITSSRPQGDENVKFIATFETLSGTEWIGSDLPHQFVPNLFIEIDESNLMSKINAMESYDFEKDKYPHPRSPSPLKVKQLSEDLLLDYIMRKHLI